MRQKFTLLALLFMFSTFAFGQSALKNHDNYLESRIVKHLKDANHKNRKSVSEKIFHKQQMELQRTSLKSAQENKHRLDSLVQHEWDSSNSQWISSYKVGITYNAQGNVAENDYYQKNEIDGPWVINWKAVYTYDDKGNVTLEIDYVWDENESLWFIYWKYEYTYDSNGNTLTEITSELDEISGQLVIVSKAEYTYGEFGMTQYLYSERDADSGLLVAYWKEVISYDSNGYMTIYTDYYWDGDSGQWLINGKTEISYDSNGNVVEYINYYWDEDSDEWYGYTKSVYVYAVNGNIITAIDFEMDMISSEFVMAWKGEYDYDANGNPTMEMYYNYDGESSEFIVYSKYDYSYDLLFGLNDLIMPSVDWFTPDFSNQIMNKPTEYTYSGWDSDLEDWIAAYKSIYYYSEDNSTNVNELGKEISKIYPNPVAENLTLSIAGNNANATFDLFDLQGRKLLSKVVNNNERISLKNMDSGMYIYRINVNGNKQTGKLIKE